MSALSLTSIMAMVRSPPHLFAPCSSGLPAPVAAAARLRSARYRAQCCAVARARETTPSSSAPASPRRRAAPRADELHPVLFLAPPACARGSPAAPRRAAGPASARSTARTSATARQASARAAGAAASPGAGGHARRRPCRRRCHDGGRRARGLRAPPPCWGRRACPAGRAGVRRARAAAATPGRGPHHPGCCCVALSPADHGSRQSNGSARSHGLATRGRR